jgi:hypothetical protein
MTKRSQCLVVATLCTLLAVVTSASAEEPAGFLEWTWGTPKATLESKFLLPRCKSRTSGPAEPTVCGPYQLGDIEILSLRLNFKPDDALSGGPKRDCCACRCRVADLAGSIKANISLGRLSA